VFKFHVVLSLYGHCDRLFCFLEIVKTLILFTTSFPFSDNFLQNFWPRPSDLSIVWRLMRCCIKMWQQPNHCERSCVLNKIHFSKTKLNQAIVSLSWPLRFSASAMPFFNFFQEWVLTRRFRGWIHETGKLICGGAWSRTRGPGKPATSCCVISSRESEAWPQRSFVLKETQPVAVCLETFLTGKYSLSVNLWAALAVFYAAFFWHARELSGGAAKFCTFTVLWKLQAQRTRVLCTIFKML